MFGVNIGLDSIQLAQVSKIRDKFYLEKYEIIDAAKALKNGFNIKIKEAVITIPDEKNNFFTYSIENPKKYSIDAIKKIITEKSKDFLKTPIEKLNTEFQVLRQYPKNGISYLDIFAEIINIDTLNNYRSILEKLKIKPIAIDSSTYRLLNLCDAQNFALVNITKNEVIIFCCLDGKPKYTRRVTKEELKFPDNMLKLIDIKYLFRFIKDTLDYHIGNNNAKIEKLFMAGEFGNSNEFIQVLSQFLEIPVEVVSKTKRINLKSTIDEETLLKIAPCIGAVLGEL